MVERGIKPESDEYHNTIPTYNSIIRSSIKLLEKDLGVPYEDTEEFKQEEVRVMQDERSELEQYNYLNPEETQKLLEERGLSHFIRGIPFKYESEEQSKSDA